SLGRLVLRRVSNPGGLPVMSANIYINVLATSQPMTVRHRGNITGVNGRLDAIDDRLTMGQVRGDSLWATHNISVNNEGTVDAPRTRNGIRWYEITGINTNSPALRQAGTLFAQTATNTEDERNYFMPSLAVSGQGHMLIGGSTAGTSEYVNAAIANRLAGDPLGVLQSPLLISASPGPYNPSSDSGNLQGRRRWGDYSFTSVDPCDDMTLWTVQQFADAANSYGLRLAKIPAPPPAAPAAANPPSVAAGLSSVNVTIAGLSSPDGTGAGSGFYDPGGAFSCRLRATVSGASGGVTVNSVSYVNPTTITLNLSTVNATAGTKSVTITNPDGQTATGVNILTVGNCAYSVTANNSAFTAAGGIGTVSVETATACGWTAISNSGFIAINSGAVGSGTGTVSFTVAPTTGLERTGTISVAGQTIAITQSAGNGCIYTLTPAAKNFPATGGSGSLTVAAAAECQWTATASDSFIGVLFTSGGQGNGTINFTVAANDQPIQRAGTITIGGQVFNVTQDAAPFELAVDDGGFETAAGISTGGTSYRVNRLTPAFYPATINAVSIYFPDNASLRVGDQYHVVIASNPDGDANIDGLAFQTIAAQVQQVGTFNAVNVPPVTITSGDFVVGVKLTQAENVFPFALDTTRSKTRSYRSLDGVTFELIDSLGSFGNYGLRARLMRPPKLIIGAGSALVTESCLPANKVIDPGETVTVNLSLGNSGSSATQNLTATLLASGNVLTLTQSAAYGAMTPGAPAIARQFTFTASGACGGTLPVSLNLKDGDQDLGIVTFNFTLGAVG
ncbi:MAG: BACON domain-containing protein, partial [Acidobacteriota bacterium]